MLSREQLESTIDCYKKHCNDCKMFKEVDVKYIGCIGLVTKTALKLMDQVEAQQQEIEQLKKIIKDKSNIIQSYSGIADRLIKAKNTQSNELQILKNAISLSEREIEKLKSQNTEYIETLNKARELLAALNYRGGLGYEAHEWIDGTLEAIDKAIGGGQ